MKVKIVVTRLRWFDADRVRVTAYAGDVCDVPDAVGERFCESGEAELVVDSAPTNVEPAGEPAEGTD